MTQNHKFHQQHIDALDLESTIKSPGDVGFLTIKDMGIEDIEKYKLPVTQRMKTKPDVQRQILNSNGLLIVELIINGWSFDRIAKKLGIATTTFFMWKKDSEFSQLIEMAIEESAERDADMAVSVLIEKAGEKEIADVTRRKALSDALKWRAGKRKPKVYGKTDNSTNININTGRVDENKEFNDLVNLVVKKNQSMPNRNLDQISDAELAE